MSHSKEDVLDYDYIPPENKALITETGIKAGLTNKGFIRCVAFPVRGVRGHSGEHLIVWATVAVRERRYRVRVVFRPEPPLPRVVPPYTCENQNANHGGGGQDETPTRNPNVRRHVSGGVRLTG